MEYLQQTDLGALSTNDLMVDADTGEAQSRFVGLRPARVTMAIVADAVGVELEIYSGTRQIVPRSQVPAGGTVGVFPNLNEQAFSFFAAAGEKLRVILRETANVATTDVMATVDVAPR